MKYSQFINEQMLEHAKNSKSVFLGYNIVNGSQGYGTFKDIPREKMIEMPTAEQSMTGIATGLALDGLLPVLFFERHDFLLLAADQIINHLGKIETLSHGEFKPKVIIRAVIGHNKPFNPGPQHIGDYADMFDSRVKDFVYRAYPYNIRDVYEEAMESKKSRMIIEYKEYYGTEI